MRTNGEYWTNGSAPLLVAPLIGALALLAARRNLHAPTERPAEPSPGAGPAFLSTNDDHSRNAVPFTFVGRENDCAFAPATQAPAGSRIVSALWMGGMG